MMKALVALFFVVVFVGVAQAANYELLSNRVVTIPILTTDASGKALAPPADDVFSVVSSLPSVLRAVIGSTASRAPAIVINALVQQQINPTPPDHYVTVSDTREPTVFKQVVDTTQSNVPLPIGSNYLYFANDTNALKYLAGGTISGTAANLTGVTAIAVDVQPNFRTISGSLAGSGPTRTMTIGIPFYMTVPVGEHVSFSSLTPASWNESCVVTASTPGTVTCLNPNASGTYVGGGLGGTGLFVWNNMIVPTMAHSRGISVIDFIGGGCETGDCTSRMTYQARAGVDAIMVDEPGPSQSGWNTVISYWKSHRPGGFFGITTGDETGALIYSYVNPPYNLALDYASVEYYVSGSSNNSPFVADGMTTSHPNIKTIALMYATTALCANYGTFPLSSFNTIGFWDVDNFGPLANTTYMDYNWLQNAQIYAETGSAASICNLAVSFYGHSSPAGNHQTGSFTVTTADNMDNPNSPYTIKSCQYSVYAGANLEYGLDDPSSVQTVPWTTKPCNGATGTVTVGSGGNCNVNSIIDVAPANLGNETFTCAVAYRALMSNGAFGDETYTLFRIN
jgi:hypothetical protein